MPLTSNQLVLAVVAVATNNRLYAWEEWQHAVNNADGSGTIYSGIDLYIFDPTRNTWTPDVAASRPTDGLADNNAPDGMDSALWTGTNILVPPTELLLVRRLPRAGDLRRPGRPVESEHEHVDEDPGRPDRRLRPRRLRMDRQRP